MLDRREMLAVSAGALAASLWAGNPLYAAEQQPRTGPGLVIYTQSIRRKAMRRRDPKHDLWEPNTFLEHAAQIGAAGIQGVIGILDSTRAMTLRKRAEELGMYLEASLELPKNQTELDRFDAEIRTVAECGGRAARSYFMGGRRYEEFSTLQELKDFHADGRRRLQLAASIMTKHRVPLAVENHKDQRTDELVEHLQSISSEYVGCCVDTGNSIALLEDPVQTVTALAPWAHSVHLKDQAVQNYEDGFLLGDIALGDGMIDLKRVVETLRQHKPKIRFNLELITRDPLKITCLTEKYWATMPGVSGRELARMLKTVQQHNDPALKQISAMDEEAQVQQEAANVRDSLKFAREQLGI